MFILRGPKAFFYAAIAKIQMRQTLLDVRKGEVFGEGRIAMMRDAEAYKCFSRDGRGWV